MSQIMPAPLSAPIAEPVVQRPRILFVDDEPRILLALKALFRGHYEVVGAVGGPAAIEIMKTQKLDVIVSDQRMPLMTGIQVLQAARELQPQAVRLLLTGYSDLNAIVGSINEGEIFRFVNKPWANDDLRATLAAAVEASQVAPIMVTEQATTAGADPVAANETGGVGVLILDADSSERDALKAALNHQWTVYTAASAEECVSLLEKHRIGVIITEMVVNGDNVLGLLTALRQHQPALVTIVVTDHADAGHAINLINHGQIYKLLQKPVKDNLVRGTVNMACRRFETLQQNPEQTQRLAPSAAAPPPGKLEKTGLLSRIRKLLVQ